MWWHDANTAYSSASRTLSALQLAVCWFVSFLEHVKIMRASDSLKCLGWFLMCIIVIFTFQWAWTNPQQRINYKIQMHNAPWTMSLQWNERTKKCGRIDRMLELNLFDSSLRNWWTNYYRHTAHNNWMQMGIKKFRGEAVVAAQTSILIY